MGLVTLTDISVNFFERGLLQGVGLQVETGERIGLVGPNGSGKTTLLRIITGEMTPDSGEVKISKGLRLGYLPQDIKEADSGRLLRSILHSIERREAFEARLKKAEADLNKTRNRDRQTAIGEEISELHQEIALLDDMFPPHHAEKILLGLGFTCRDFDRPIAELSGGWKMRAVLAQLLYQRPDLLLLDEPTNHLDLPSVRWLEDFLRAFTGALILVSHDRDFLNRQVGRILSFEPEGLRSYPGNYDAYVQAREAEIEALEAKAKKQEQKIKDARKFIERFQAKSSKARQAQSKIKLVQKMALVETRQTETRIRFAFPEVMRSGREVATLTGIGKQFGDNILYDHVDLTILRGERIAVVGPNGCGKTTLLRLIAGEMVPDQGVISLGHKVNIAYFAQHHTDLLNPNHTVLEEVYRMVPDASLSFVRSVCGAFLFSGNDVDKSIQVLSGGERARVSLAKLLVAPGNFMLMDEPTNHLDINSSEMLIKALSQYNGTLLFVSHNQYFVNRLATKILDIADTSVHEYPGNLDEYYAHLAEVASPSSAPGPGKGGQEGVHTGETDRSPRGKPPDRKKERQQRAKRRQKIHNLLNPIQNELREMEDRITRLEDRQKAVEKRLADPKVFEDKEISVPLLTEYKETRGQIQDLLSKWEDGQKRLESAKTALEAEG
ncbi:MAG: ABC-F family ATP-binding cassette domain-containing protein [Deltaproteobacteria bacterium]|nr:ABC-F family ATP-binding cassette domain-containing protein [Deltaproteobacteria bacterium]MCF8118932.1 ABC-F family ATP-binding cassette domain-containing protein [Deltaproteobacteria bacterium]